jgi:DNA-binding NarL/FixJ family response regulator
MNEVRATLAQLRGEPLSPPPGSLTPRQAEILACLADGSSNREIAERLHLSRATVERHLATAYAKLGLRNRVEAARYALQHGLLPPTP